MNTPATIVLIIVLVIIVAVIGLLIARQAQKRRSERLKERFGPEYDRAVEHADDRRAAEAELVGREKRHRGLELRELDSGQRREFEQRWADIQGDFVDGPGRAVGRADRLVVDVMGARGYPVEEFDQRADDLSVQHPEVTARYREARRIARANERGEANTEDLRGALTSYRSLIDALLDGGRGGGGERDTSRNTDGATEAGRRGEPWDNEPVGDRPPADQADDTRSSERTGRGAMTGTSEGQEGRG